MNASGNGSADEVIGCASVSVSCCRRGCPNDVASGERVSGNASVRHRGRCEPDASHAIVSAEWNGNESASGSHCDGHHHGCANETAICIHTTRRRERENTISQLFGKSNTTGFGTNP